MATRTLAPNEEIARLLAALTTVSEELKRASSIAGTIPGWPMLRTEEWCLDLAAQVESELHEVRKFLL